MSEKKGWGSSLLGLWVVRDDKDPDKAAAAPAGSGGEPGSGDSADAAPSDGAAPASPLPGAEFVSEPPAAPGGKVDFAAVYAAAGIDDEEQARVAKAAELLSALPAGSEPARQIVEASLKAFGVPVEKIIAAGEKEIRALAAYVETGAADTRTVLADAQQRIAQYQEEIQRIRQVMDQRVAEQQSVERACEDGKQAVARVLQFFGHTAPAAAPASASPPTSSGRSHSAASSTSATATSAAAAAKPIDPSERSA
jgi:hypothetical protein